MGRVSSRLLHPATTPMRYPLVLPTRSMHDGTRVRIKTTNRMFGRTETGPDALTDAETTRPATLCRQAPSAGPAFSDSAY